MKVVKPSFAIESEVDGDKILRNIEKAGRTCYKSEEKITSQSAKKFVAGLIKRGHESVIEHFSVTVRIICDRGVTHEIVRHRHGSYSQESTRYCNYSKDKYDNQLTFVKPFFWDSDNEEDKRKYEIWESVMESIEKKYLELVEMGAKPQEARSILPNSLKTEIAMTMNLRSWRNFFILRTARDAHPQMREVAIPILEEFKRLIPIVFDDIDIS